MRSSNHRGHRREHVFRRQAPMSCVFCRSKKLKCDRQTPCSNCIARGLQCVSAFTGHGSNSQEISRRSDPAVDSRRTEELEERVKRLEAALYSTMQKDTLMAEETTGERQEVADGLTHTQSHYQTPISDALAEVNQAGEDPRSYFAATRIGEPISDLQEDRSLADSSLQSEEALAVSQLLYVLPTLPLARTLVAFYSEKLSWVQHIIHVPTTYHELDSIYNKLQSGVKPESAKLSLIAAIITVAAFFWPDPLRDDSGHHGEDAKSHSRRWLMLVERTLEEANHLTCPTIETMQAKLILLQFHPSYSQKTGRSSQIVLLINQAHILQLHRLDSPRQCKARANSAEDVVKLELQRRVWWTVVLMDWMSSIINWGRLGTYLIHPDHMRVRYPRNSNDVDLAANGNIDQPLSGPPTQMSCFIAKLQGAGTMRECMDIANKSDIEMDEADYSLIMTFDKKISDFLSSLPSYLRYEGTSESHLQQYFKERPYLEQQRSILLSGLYNGLAQLHRQFLGRAYRDLRYSYSRVVCLRSTRIVIELQEAIRHSLIGHTWLVLHHVSVAATTLMMEYSYNRDNPQVAAQIKQDILKCYRILKESGEQYAEVKQGLESLQRTMQEWKNRGKTSQQDAPSSGGEADILTNSVLPLSWSQYKQVSAGMPAKAPEWASSTRDSIVTWTADTPTAAAGINNTRADRLSWSTGAQSGWPTQAILPLSLQQGTAVDQLQLGPSLSAQQYSAEMGSWIETDSDPRLPCTNEAADIALESQWEELFRNLDAQQFMTGF